MRYSCEGKTRLPMVVFVIMNFLRAPEVHDIAHCHICMMISSSHPPAQVIIILPIHPCKRSHDNTDHTKALCFWQLNDSSNKTFVCPRS